MNIRTITDDAIKKLQFDGDSTAQTNLHISGGIALHISSNCSSNYNPRNKTDCYMSCESGADKIEQGANYPWFVSEDMECSSSHNGRLVEDSNSSNTKEGTPYSQQDNVYPEEFEALFTAVTMLKMKHMACP